MTKALGVVVVAFVAAAACGDDGPRDCVWEGRTYRHGERWQCGGGTCDCVDGGVQHTNYSGGVGGSAGSGADASGPFCEDERTASDAFGNTTDCGNFACQGGYCPTSCSADEQCAGEAYCFLPQQRCILPSGSGGGG